MKPINLKNWIEAHRHLLKPPVGNQQIFTDNKDFIVMVVGGPNARKDFHVNQGEELFYQLEGEIEIGLMLEDPDHKGQFKEDKLTIGEGDLFLLPAGVPHCPRRGPGTIGLVIERPRLSDELDGFQWYCEKCGHLLHETKIPVTDLVKELPVVMDAFYNHDTQPICQKCGTRMERP
jgi:3-hydroxyanthranilate 3,4-dioxygenase